MTAQYFNAPDGTKMAIVPATEYQEALKIKEMTLDDAINSLKMDHIWQYYWDTPCQQVPTELFYRVLEGENPIRVYRKWRGYKVGELAQMVGVSTSYMSTIEAGKREGKIGLYDKIAAALGVCIEYIIPVETQQIDKHP